MNQEQVWDILAESWNNFRQRVYEKELYNLDWKKGRLLDIGCGNCRNISPFKNLELYGIDFSSEMIKHSKIFTQKHNLKVNLKKANMKEIPFKDNFFDYCLSLNSLHHINKEEANGSLKEIYRILKKNGQCYITIWNKYPQFLFRKKETYFTWKQKDKVYRRYYYLYSYFEFKKLLLKNNFKIIESGRIFDKNIKFLIQK